MSQSHLSLFCVLVSRCVSQERWMQLIDCDTTINYSCNESVIESNSHFSAEPQQIQVNVWRPDKKAYASPPHFALELPSASLETSNTWVKNWLTDQVLYIWNKSTDCFILAVFYKGIRCSFMCDLSFCELVSLLCRKYWL